MHKVKYVFELKKGYMPVMECEEEAKENEVTITIEASCVANAERAIKALFEKENVKTYTSYVIE